MQVPLTLFITVLQRRVKTIPVRCGMCIWRQTTDNGASFTQSTASNTPNHNGVICTNGTGCAPGTRNLLNLFKVAINPGDGRAGIIYTDDTLTQDSSGNPLPQIVLAQQQ